MRIENWRPVPGWDGLYSISDLGNIRSEHRVVAKSDGTRQTVPERLLKAVPDPKGSLRVQLFRENRGVTRYIHQMVMAAFVGPQPEGLQVCHGNGNKVDNRLENLRYDTDSANKFDSVRHGTHANARKKRCPQMHPYTPANTAMYDGPSLLPDL